MSLKTNEGELKPHAVRVALEAQALEGRRGLGGKCGASMSAARARRRAHGRSRAPFAMSAVSASTSPCHCAGAMCRHASSPGHDARVALGERNVDQHGVASRRAIEAANGELHERRAMRDGRAAPGAASARRAPARTRTAQARRARARVEWRKCARPNRRKQQQRPGRGERDEQGSPRAAPAA